MAQQNTEILNHEAIVATAAKNAARGAFTTVQTPTGQITARQNQIGYNAPSLTAYRNATPNGNPVREALLRRL